MNKFLIVGQGAAGSFLAWELLKRGKRITIVDNRHQTSASIISAGIINPLAGKRLTLTEGFQSFWAHARQAYRALEAHFNQTFFEPHDIVRIFRDEEEKRQYLQRALSGNYQSYCKKLNPPKAFAPALNDELGSLIVQNAGYCHAARLLCAFQKFFRDHNDLIVGQFDYDDLAIERRCVRYGGDRYDKIIFCEGYRAQWNPWFHWLPFNCAKGEILALTLKGDPLPQGIINKGKWCVPVAGGQWRAGSNYEWGAMDCEPTREGRDEIISGLNQCLNHAIEVKGHQAGVRPVLKDQMPILGPHPDYPPLAIFNGLGSKGFLTAPLYASLLADFLCAKANLPLGLTAGRFAKSGVLSAFKENAEKGEAPIL